MYNNQENNDMLNTTVDNNIPPYQAEPTHPSIGAESYTQPHAPSAPPSYAGTFEEKPPAPRVDTSFGEPFAAYATPTPSAADVPSTHPVSYPSVGAYLPQEKISAAPLPVEAGAYGSGQSHGGYEAQYPTYGSHYSQTRGPAVEAASTDKKSKPVKKRSLLPIAALCLCFTLVGGTLGGAIGSGAFSPTPAAVNSPDIPKSNDITPVVYQPGTILSWNDVFSQCNPGVVAISTEIVQRNAFGRQVAMPAAGSGFIISNDGYVVTNNHVIADASSINVLLSDGSTHKAKLIGRDPTNDLAVLKVDAQNLHALSWGDSEHLPVGTPVAAIGNPLGELANSMTEGIISALGREINIDGTPMTMLQTDASVSPGNSGGPLIDQSGRVVGIVSAKSVSTEAEGIGFAIPANVAKPIIDELIEFGHVTGRPQLGINIQTIDESSAQYYNLPVGVYVISVAEGSCSNKAGLKIRDVITEFGGVKITSNEQLTAQKNKYKAGETVTMKVWRDGTEITLSVVLDETPEIAELPPVETQQDSDEDMMIPPWFGQQLVPNEGGM